MVVAETTTTQTTWIPASSQGYTSTYKAQGTTIGEVLVGSPSAGWTTTTVYTTAGAAVTTTTLQSAYDGTMGTVEVITPSASTVYTTITSGGTAYTTTLASGTNNAAGTIEVSSGNPMRSSNC